MRCLWVLLAFAMLGCRDDPRSVGESISQKPMRETSFEEEPLPAHWLKGRPVDDSLARVPRFRPDRDGELGLKCLPDGDIGEWEGKSVEWLTPASIEPNGLKAKLAMASYGSGLSLAVEVEDDAHQKARVVGALDRSDHIEVELWPHRMPRPNSREDEVLGLHLRLGTERKLVDIIRTREAWREAEISSAGVSVPGGYRVEARIPLSVMTPIAVPRVENLHYRITIHDARDEGQRAKPTLLFEGRVQAKPAMEVPEAVQKRASIRVCRAAFPQAMWGFVNGWRCMVPYSREILHEDDTRPESEMALATARVPEPPQFIWIRERLMFINLLGLDRGVTALLDKRDTILSIVSPLGVVGAQSPGNARTKHSDAESMVLPDGTYAVVTTHAFPAQPGPLGGRCAGGHKVYLSIFALRGALKSTPHERAPEPETPPFLEEVFRTLLEDCTRNVANDWSLSRDRKTIKVHSSLYPSRPPAIWIFGDGRYHPAASEASR